MSAWIDRRFDIADCSADLQGWFIRPGRFSGARIVDGNEVASGFERADAGSC
jgi:hypothetical protein